MSRVIGSQDLIKRLNLSLVQETILKHQPINRAQIAKKLNLSRSTVSSLVDELLRKKMVVELGLGESTQEGGRRGVKLGFNPKSAFGIGVDIGGTKINVFITDLKGEIIYREKVETTADIQKVIYIIKKGLEEAQIEESEIIAMGVGVPGITNSKEGIVLDAPALKWTNVNLREQLTESFNFPVFINNDVNCAALGERWLGSGKNTNDMLFISIGTGVGSAIISDGELIYGHNYQSGEIAYNVSEEDVRLGNYNKLGEFGLFEKKTSGQALSQNGFTSRELFQEYEKGNPKAIPIIKDFIQRLSIAIVNAINLLNPESVVIGGGVSESMGTVIREIEENVNRLTPIKTKIRLASLGGDAGSYGAIAYALEEIENKSLMEVGV